MANNSVYEKIELKGSLDAKEILRLGEEQAKAIEENILTSATQDIQNILLAKAAKNQEIVRTKKTELIQKTKQECLHKKQELISKVFDEVKEKMKAMSDEELFNLVVNMIKKENLTGAEVIKVSMSDYSRYLKLFSSKKDAGAITVLDKLNESLNNKKYNLQLSKETLNIDGGFVIIGESFDIDNSFQAIVNQFKEKYEADVAKILFIGGE